MVKVAVVVDTPNIGKSIQNRHSGHARPDYRALRQLAGRYGAIIRCCALVNDGVSTHFVRKLKDLHFEVRFSHGFDCDDALIACAVRLRKEADCLVLCSGDKHYIPLVGLLIDTGMRIIVCAVDGACNRTLKAIAQGYAEMPIRSRIVRLPQLAASYSQTAVR